VFRNSIRRFVTILLVLTPAVAGAVGMGRLTVLSTLGQPFRAELDLISVQKNDLSSLSARIAAPDEYKMRNLEYGPSLNAMRLTIQSRPGGGYFVNISTTRPVNDLFVNLLVELNWNNGHILRGYTALIDPPGFTPAQTSVPARVSAAQSRPMSRRPSVAATPLATEKKAAKYVRVKRGDTLSKIARSTKPKDVSVDQMLVGLYRSNPHAFIRNNMNLLKAGVKLRIPERESVAALTRKEARKEVRLQTSNWREYRRKLANVARPASKHAHKEPAKAPGRVEEKASEGKGPKDVLRLSPGMPASRAKGQKKSSRAERVRVLEEELIAREKALKEANERIKELEKAVKESTVKPETAK